uniref:SH3 domain-containing protein n=1 Tax=Echinostoma caproni TaxID=27848 RepID=A0A183AJH9_9TREM
LFMFKIDAHSFTRNEPPTNELHVFQVLSCPAKEIVDQLLHLGADPDYSLADNHVDSPDMFHSRKLASHVVHPHVTSNATMSRSMTSMKGNTLPRHPEYHYAIDVTAEEISTGLINAEVELLNLCFDDIEETLQLMRDRPEKNRRRSSASTFGTLTKTRNRLKSRGSIIPLECSADPQFRFLVEDFFQKVKFACILLSRLSDYVKEPKAPELIKKVFNILKEGVTICRLPKTNRADIPRSIIYPRLPAETVRFMQKHLTSEQNDLLLELGPTWNTPREDSNDQTVYVPTFRKPYDIDKDAYDPTLFRFNEDVDNNPERRYIQRAQLSRYAKELMARGADLVKVIVGYRAKSPRELTVVLGEYLELLDEHKDWFRVRNAEGEEGYCPAIMMAHCSTTDCSMLIIYQHLSFIRFKNYPPPMPARKSHDRSGSLIDWSDGSAATNDLLRVSNSDEGSRVITHGVSAAIAEMTALALGQLDCPPEY